MLGKYLVRAALFVGLVAFFLPVIVIQQKSLTVGLSSATLVQGREEIARSMGRQVSRQLLLGENRAPLDELLMASMFANTRELGSYIDAFRIFFTLLFAPTLLLLVVTLGSLRQYGRGLAVVALVAGILAAVIWAYVSGTSFESGSYRLGLGVDLILVSGVLGALGGVEGIVRPEP
jgi:hypothetical protein